MHTLIIFPPLFHFNIALAGSIRTAKSHPAKPLREFPEWCIVGTCRQANKTGNDKYGHQQHHRVVSGGTQLDQSEDIYDIRQFAEW